MNYYIIITFEGKKYKIPLNTNFLIQLQSQNFSINFDNNNYLQRTMLTPLETYKFNKMILDVLLAELHKIPNIEAYEDIIKECTEVYVPKNPNNFDMYLLTKKVDTLFLLYYELQKQLSNQNSTFSHVSSQSNKNVVTQDIHPLVQEAKTKIAKQIEEGFLRGLITLEQLDDSLKKVYICKNDTEFKEIYLKNCDDLTAEEKKDISIHISQIKGFMINKNNTIILPPNFSIETLIHELCHTFSNQVEKNLIILFNRLKQINTGFSLLTELHANILDEGITDFITSLILPEQKMSTAYSYMMDFLAKYCKKEEHLIQILRIYFKQSQKDLLTFFQSINSTNIVTFKDLLDSALIYQAVNNMLIPLKALEKCITAPKIDELIAKLNNEENLKL